MSSPNYKVEYLAGSKDVVENRNGKATINYPLELREVMFHGFILKKLETALKNGLTEIFIETSEQQQAAFNNYVSEHFSFANIKNQNLALDPLIKSIWRKAGEQVLNRLLQEERMEAFKVELKQMQSMRQKTPEGSPGSYFTPRQVELMISATHLISEDGKKRS